MIPPGPPPTHNDVGFADNGNFSSGFYECCHWHLLSWVGDLADGCIFRDWRCASTTATTSNTLANTPNLGILHALADDVWAAGPRGGVLPCVYVSWYYAYWRC